MTLEHVLLELGTTPLIYKDMVKKALKLTVDPLEENVEDALAWNRQFVSIEEVVLDAFLVVLR